MDRNDESFIYARAVLFATAARCKNCTREVVNLRYFIRDTASPMQIGGTAVRTSREVTPPTNRSADSNGCAIAKYEMIEIMIHFFPECRVNNVIIIMRDTISFHFLSEPNNLL